MTVHLSSSENSFFFLSSKTYILEKELIALCSQITSQHGIFNVNSLCPLNVPMLPVATVYSSCPVALCIVTSGTVAPVGEHLFAGVSVIQHFCSLFDKSGVFGSYPTVFIQSTQFNPSAHWKETSKTSLKYMTQ